MPIHELNATKKYSTTKLSNGKWVCEKQRLRSDWITTEPNLRTAENLIRLSWCFADLSQSIRIATWLVFFKYILHDTSALIRQFFMIATFKVFCSNFVKIKLVVHWNGDVITGRIQVSAHHLYIDSFNCNNMSNLLPEFCLCKQRRLTIQHECTCSSEPSLLTYVINNKIVCAGILDCFMNMSS